MTPDLSLPSHNPKLNTYGNTNWDNASFVLYTLIDLPHIELIRKASTFGERWMQASEYSDPHLIRTSPNPQLHQQNPQRHSLRPDHHGQGNDSPLRSQRRRGSGLDAYIMLSSLVFGDEYLEEIGEDGLAVLEREGVDYFSA
ncbi:uncharacterized protein ACHE_20630A [Aspergillus chevalieri]|uniref:Uncharacterized protein n=1 Tax=Aspergillus chevalieri TaxID=182096 RepID=A0A7R7ZLI9_ASPCH|nr:uncharacterized protein ACHE_20630A [Aspergillus chevalieri]BCR85172.1 hypothetical protein ACHE_20630A [Aspergillus chevalieri]